MASLEERVSELSELLGACERARQKDQQTAQRLRERVLQLDTENKTLAIAASSSTAGRASDLIHTLNVDEANLDTNALKEKLELVKKLLKMAAQRNLQQQLEIQKLGEEGHGKEVEKGEEEGEVVGRTKVEESDAERRSALFYQQELKQVKEEFERYKVRAQVVLKNKNAKDGSQAKELEEARDQLAELKEKYINLRIHADEAEARHRRNLEERQQGALSAQQAHKQELERHEAQHRETLLRLEAEMHKQRDRTMALLTEKDQELERLRGTVATANVFGFASHRSNSVGASSGGGGTTSETDGGGAGWGSAVRSLGGEDVELDSQAQEESDFITQALRLAGPNEPTLLLYAEQLARKEVENGALRRQKRRLEEDLHQLQGKLIANGERHDEEVAELRAELDKRVRDQGRDGANLEYLKNIIYKYLTLQDTRGRQQTLTAILTILHFSPQEKQAVIKQHAQGWWTPGMR